MELIPTAMRRPLRKHAQVPGASSAYQDDDLLIGVVGRLSPEKGGVDNLIRATYQLPEQHRKVRLLIVGDGPVRANLENLDAGLREGNAGEGSPVIFAGARQDIPRLLGAMDIFVLPSLNEALPIVILEAMAVGLPVVATRVGGVPEIVQDGATGLLVAPGDEAALLDALSRLAEDPALRRQAGRCGARTGACQVHNRTDGA